MQFLWIPLRSCHTYCCTTQHLPITSVEVIQPRVTISCLLLFYVRSCPVSCLYEGAQLGWIASLELKKCHCTFPFQLSLLKEAALEDMTVGLFPSYLIVWPPWFDFLLGKCFWSWLRELLSQCPSAFCSCTVQRQFTEIKVADTPPAIHFWSDIETKPSFYS